MKLWAPVLFLVAILAGCGQATQQPAAAPPAALQHIYALTADQHIGVYDLQGHQERTLPAGIPAPDWSLLYVAVGGSVQAVDTRTGAVVRSLDLGANYAMPRPNLAGLPQGLSPDGRWLALGGKGRFAIVDTAFKRKPVFVDLKGDFEFDALSNDGLRLYLAEVIPTGYEVRLYDLAAGLYPRPLADKTDPDATMSGFRVTSVDPPDGLYHFGLYVRPGRQPFIHALPLGPDQPVSFCVFLPWPGYDAPAPDWSLVRSSDGSFLYATSGVLRRAVEVRATDLPSVTRTLDVPQLAGFRNPLVTDAEAKADMPAPGAVLSGDGRRLYFPDVDGVDVVDLGGFKLSARWLPGEFVESLVAGPDGSLFALTERGTVARLDAASGRVTGYFPLQGVQRLLMVSA